MAWSRFMVLLGLMVAPLQTELEAQTFTVPLDRYSIKDWECFQDHLGFYPYLCEFGYRTLADHVIDPNHLYFDPNQVKPGDSIYCAVWYLDWFTEVVHDKISHPYVLITCDVGSWIPSPNHLKLAYDPKVVCWFAKNMLFTHHPKFFQLPMGQFYYLWASSISPSIEVLNRLVASPNRAKDILLYLNHTERNHGRRIEVADQFTHEPYCFSRNRPRRSVGFPEYWEEVSRSKFVLSPLGLEVDCTRTWECFALGAIPIVEHSYLDPLYEDLRILLIHDWNQIDEDFLNKQYDLIQAQPQKLERAFIDYWKDLIHQKQQLIRQGDRSMGILETTQFPPSDLNAIKEILSQHNKLNEKLIYYGNMSCLRPFQLARTIGTLPYIDVVDLWTSHGLQYLKQFVQDASLVNTTRVRVHDPSHLNKRLAIRNKSVFLDLTYFRHKLLRSVSELTDFRHSLEGDIIECYNKLRKGELLFGNEATDPYVSEVLKCLQENEHLNIKIAGQFWTVVKKESGKT